MAEQCMQTPVVFLVFNRPERTRESFAAIRRARPERLLVVADGPRDETEASACNEVRTVVEDGVDWPCNVETRYSSKNLGCRTRVSSGIDWAFEKVDRAIFVEDDILPSDSFFPYCEAMLDRYADEERVMHVSGAHFLPEAAWRPKEYVYSEFAFIWGWASWRRAWRYYDVDIEAWPQARARNRHHEHYRIGSSAYWWENCFEDIRNGYDSWDHQWNFALMMQDGLAVQPRVNLISNRGFGADATHTTDPEGGLADWPRGEVELPMRGPSRMERSREVDAYSYRKCFGLQWKDRALRNWWQRFRGSLARR